MAQLEKLLSLSSSDRSALIEAAVQLAAARLSLYALPFARIAQRLGRRSHESPSEPIENGNAERVSWAIGVVAYRVPGLTCLTQAIAGQRMLRRRGLPSTVYLGVAKAEDGAVEAHAWLRCGTQILTGGGGHERYTVVGTFA